MDDCLTFQESSCLTQRQTVIEGSRDGYPELEEKKEFIFKVLAKEEDQFNKTIDQGLSILADMGRKR